VNDDVLVDCVRAVAEGAEPVERGGELAGEVRVRATADYGRLGNVESKLSRERVRPPG
jgi:hypothetical protein